MTTDWPLVGEFKFGDMTVRYPHDESSGKVGLWLIPTARLDHVVSHRPWLTGHEIEPIRSVNPNLQAVRLDSLVQFKLRGEGESGAFAGGVSLRNSPSLDDLRFEGQEVIRNAAATEVVTRFRRPDGFCAAHHLRWETAQPFIRVWTTVSNESDRPVVLEMLASFSIGGITPFATDDACGRLRVHRFRSAWSAEGRLVSDSIERLHLERSWLGMAARCERFGQVGSMPTNRFFPQALVEDTAAGVLWGAALAWAGAWQMEFYRLDDWLNFSGGLADFEFGHWARTLAPGESFTSPPATLTVAVGDVDATCQRLTAAQVAAAEAQPAVERELPICFNEWCTSWGRPRHEDLVRLADRLRDSGVTYLVIDAGWYSGSGNWYIQHGDWEVAPELFPDGLAATAQAIRQRGLIPGLWFEMETVGKEARAFGETNLLLHRHGVPLTVGPRRFLDLNQPAALARLEQRVIGLLEQCGIGYLKVDYNATIGLGCDHPDGLGEGLRRQIEGVYRLFDRIRQRLPNLVIENCSSGGHRLESSMQSRCAVGSFSDAHEGWEIPILAANLHRLILPRQSLVWAVLRRDDSDARLAYSLAATMLGRMCLSGELTALSDRQWTIMRDAIEFYWRVAHLIRDGRSRRFGPEVESYRAPVGWQAVTRESADARELLAVAHTFRQPVPATLQVPLPAGNSRWQIQSLFPATANAHCDGATLVIEAGTEFRAVAAHLVRAAADAS